MRPHPNKLVPAWRLLLKNRLAAMLADAPGANSTPQMNIGVVHVALSDTLKQ